MRIVCRERFSALPSVFMVFMVNKYSHFLGGRSETTYEFRKNGVDCLNQSRFPGVRHIFSIADKLVDFVRRPGKSFVPQCMRVKVRVIFLASGGPRLRNYFVCSTHASRCVNYYHLFAG